MFQKLRERRVPQIVGAYIAVSWGFIQAVDWLTERYGLSPHWVEFSLIALASLLPAVLVFAWGHGAPGKDRWSRFEKTFIPLNAVVAAGILFVLFQGRDLGAVTTTVTVEDAEGNEIEAVVPKSQYRKHVGVFGFGGESTDSATAWLRWAIPIGVALDLRQDRFFDLRYAPHFAEPLRQAGQPSGLGPPLSLAREVASEQQRTYVLTGTVRPANPGATVVTELHEVETGKRVARHELSGQDPFALIDEVTDHLKRDLDVPEVAVDVRDLTVRELLTSSEAAFREFTDGLYALLQEGDWSRALPRLERAVAIDSTFAYAHAQLYTAYSLAGRGPEAAGALAAARQSEYRLAERDRFALNREYYHAVRQDPERALAVVEMSIDMFPDDTEALMIAAQFYELMGRRQDAIAAFERILEIDPGQTAMLEQVARLHSQLGEYERARDVQSRFVEYEPRNSSAQVRLADYARRAGDGEAARERCESVLLLEPEDVEAGVCIARSEADVGDLEAAEARLEEVLAAAPTASGRAAALGALFDLRMQAGRPGAALEVNRRELAEMSQSSPPLLVALRHLSRIDVYALAGRASEGRRVLAEIRAGLGAPWDVLASLGAVGLHTALEEEEELQGALAELEASIDAFGFENLRPALMFARADAARISGDCAAAEDLYATGLEVEPGAMSARIDRAACLVEAGRLDDASRELERVLRVRPAHPRALLTEARRARAAGDADAARAAYEAALDVWANAEPAYDLAREARIELTGF